jgi:hypothetical protein
LRNNNPGNIRTGIAWQGMIGQDASSFIIFQDTSWGLRALATDLSNKIREGLDTISKIVTVYAPASDNNNDATYIADVSATTGNGPDEQLGLDPQTLHDLMRGIMNHELGASYSAMIPDSDIDQGISMINANLLQLLQAAGIAAQSAVDTLTGSNLAATASPDISLWIGLGLAAGVGFLLTRKK